MSNSSYVLVKPKKTVATLSWMKLLIVLSTLNQDKPCIWEKTESTKLELTELLKKQNKTKNKELSFVRNNLS